MVLARLVLEVHGCAHGIAAHGVPELSAIVDVDGVGVVFPASDGDDLFTRREEEVVGEVPVEVGPVGALEEGVGEADVGGVDALAQVVREALAYGAVEGYHEVFPCKTMVGAGSHRVVPEIVIEGEVGTGVQMKVVEGDKRLLVLREGLHAGEETQKSEE